MTDFKIVKKILIFGKKLNKQMRLSFLIIPNILFHKNISEYGRNDC